MSWPPTPGSPICRPPPASWCPACRRSRRSGRGGPPGCGSTSKRCTCSIRLMGARSPRTSHDGGVRESSPEFDHLTAHDLRAAGSVKWTKYGGDVIGAFVAEMDFGTAPPVVAALQEAVAAGWFGYLPPDLATALARATAQWQVRRYGWQVAPEQ